MIARILAVSLVLTLASGARAQSPEALSAVDKLMAAQDVDAMMKDISENLIQSIPGQMPPEARAAFATEFNDPVFLSRYKSHMRTVMAKSFTVEEIGALTEFYSKPIAKSAMKKMGGMMGEMSPFMQAEMPALVQRVQQRVMPSQSQPQQK